MKVTRVPGSPSSDFIPFHLALTMQQTVTSGQGIFSNLKKNLYSTCNPKSGEYNYGCYEQYSN
jgi:hypothetical protein